MNSISIVLILFVPVALFPQTTRQIEQVHVDKMPQYPGGTNALTKLFLDSIEAPGVKWEEVSDAEQQGQMILSLLINEQGNVEDVKVIRSMGTKNDARCVNLARKLKFIPAMSAGKPVKMRYVFHIDREE